MSYILNLSFSLPSKKKELKHLNSTIELMTDPW